MAASVFERDSLIVTWSLSVVEIVSTLERKLRRNEENLSQLRESKKSLNELEAYWIEVTDIDQVKNRARRLLSVHDLRAADSLQLAAALLFCEERPSDLNFICFDQRLGHAAEREGFRVIS